MADKQKEKVESVIEKKNVSPSIKKESVYDIEELAQCSQQVFNVPKECLLAAFGEVKKECATLSEAKAIVQKFLKKEVQ